MGIFTEDTSWMEEQRLHEKIRRLEQKVDRIRTLAENLDKEANGEGPLDAKLAKMYAATCIRIVLEG